MQRDVFHDEIVTLSIVTSLHSRSLASKAKRTIVKNKQLRYLVCAVYIDD